MAVYVSHATAVRMQHMYEDQLAAANQAGRIGSDFPTGLVLLETTGSDAQCGCPGQSCQARSACYLAVSQAANTLCVLIVSSFHASVPL
jgi:hypothetical protein